MGLFTRGALGLLAAAAFALALLLSAVLVMAFDSGYYASRLQRYGSYGRFDSAGEADSLIGGMLDFFRGEADNAPAGFTENERSHLADVKALLDTARLAALALWLCWAGVILAELARARTLRERVFRAAKALTGAGAAALALVALLFLAALLFERAFLAFHLSFFPQGNWSFPAESSLIRLFPREFFFGFLVDAVARLALVGGMVLAAGIALGRVRFREIPAG